MRNILKKLEKVAFLMAFGTVLFSIKEAKAEGDLIYYDTFYEDYYKSFPDAKPKTRVKNTRTTYTQPVYDPYMQYQVNASFDQYQSPYTSYYQKVDHTEKKWQLDAEHKQIYGHFMFENDVGSILEWDEIDAKENFIKLSRDFMIKNRQYVLSAVYGTGSGTTSRTSDDDIFNELHIISLGPGDVKLKDYSLSLGLRNLWRIGNWDVTPIIGYKKKQQDFRMFNHVVPAPYYFDYLCSGVAQDDFGNEVCTDAIDLTKSPYISYTGVTSATEYWQNVLYYAEVDAEGYPIVDEVNGGYKRLSETVETRDLVIYGYFTDTNTSQTITNLYYKGQISAEDTCYVTNSSNGQTGRTVCVPASDDGAHLVNAFGGVSSAMQYDGVTHIYDVSWTGPFAALNLERKISDRDELNLYIEYFIPKYKVWGDWPNRSDWAHNPSFYDKGGSASAWLVDFNYKYRFKENLYAGIGAYFDYIENKNADTLLFTVNPLTNKIESTLFEKSILKSEWKSYGFNIGLTYRF